MKLTIEWTQPPHEAVCVHYMGQSSVCDCFVFRDVDSFGCRQGEIVSLGVHVDACTVVHII